MRSIATLSILATVSAALSLAAQARLPKQSTDPPAVLQSGPASLSAGSTVTGQIWLSFPWVRNAQKYRVTRSSDAPEPEQTLYEGDANAFGLDAPAGAFHHAPVSPEYIYSYRVYAIFIGPVGTTVSTPSPTASARSAPFEHPAGLKSSVQTSPTPGMTNLALTWGAVPNVEKYRLTVEGRSVPYETSSTSLVISSVPAGRTYRVCVGTVYPYNISRDASAPCITVKT